MSEKLPPKILFIEKDEFVNTNLCNTIERCWFDIKLVGSVERAVKEIDNFPPNLVIISSYVESPPSKAAVTLIQNGKLKGTPFIFLLNQGEILENYDIIISDHFDCIYRPFTPDELLSIIKALIRKAKPHLQDKIIRHKDISMDLSTYKVLRGNKEIHLGPTEFKILQLFLQKPNSTYSREAIIHHVWGADKNISYRTIDVHVNRIRTLMHMDSDVEQVIRTIRSAGYCLV